jgi:CSLREA domain-containing protein
MVDLPGSGGHAGIENRHAMGENTMKAIWKHMLCPAVILVFAGMLFGCAPISTLTVNTTDDADDGTCNATHCSLREAINEANTLTGTIGIRFNIGGGGAQTIQPTSALPILTSRMTIDGSTQPGYESAPLIELDGSLAEHGGDGLLVPGLWIKGGNSTIRALVISRFETDGIRIDTQGGNRILGCYIGTDPSGTSAAGNGTYGQASAGISIRGGEANAIGGTGNNQGNVISGNYFDGILILSASNSVVHNHVGTDVSGTTAVPNLHDGVVVQGYGTKIGGGTILERNVISGNGNDGVNFRMGENSLLQGNLIGLDITGAQLLGNGGNGVDISTDLVTVGGPDENFRNVISGNGLAGITIDAVSDKVSVFGNYIGTDKNGVTALGNIESGIVVSGTNHQIGAGGKGNLVSGNSGPGITVINPATGIKIQDNRIGTDAGGNLALGNDIGIEFSPSEGASGVLVGGPVDGGGNLISGNYQEGVILYKNAEVIGNIIGLAQDGLNALPNGSDGIRVKGVSNRIGLASQPNSIAHNGGHGVAVITEDGSATGNLISGNYIWENDGLGIALGGDAVPANDPGDPDTGDNNLQNYPLMYSAVHDPVAGQTTLSASLDSAPLAVYDVEFYVNISCDPSGYGEGKMKVAAKTVTTDGGGHADVVVVFNPIHFIMGDFFTATATDLMRNTSSFSNCIPETEQGTETPTPNPVAMTFKPFFDPAEIFFGPRCAPDKVRLSVEIGNPPEPIAYVLLFIRLMNKEAGEKTAWGGGLTMIAAGKNVFYYDLMAYDVPDYSAFESAWLQYQFVVYNKAEEKIGYSEVFGDVAFTRCGPDKPAGVT